MVATRPPISLEPHVQRAQISRYSEGRAASTALPPCLACLTQACIVLVISKKNRVTLPCWKNEALISTAVTNSKRSKLTSSAIIKNKHFNNSQGMISFRQWLVIELHGAGNLLGDYD